MESYLSFSDRHEAFCQEYVKDRNATQAAIRAGYSEKTARQQGSRLLTNAAISSRIGELQEEIAERNEIDADNIMAKLETVYERSLEEGNFAAANRAAELQGKMVGAFTERADVNVRSSMFPTTPGDLDATIERLAKIAGIPISFATG